MVNEVQKLLDSFGVNAFSIMKLEGYGSTNYKITDDCGDQFVLKHYTDQKELPLLIEEIGFVDKIKENLPYQVPYTLEKQNERIHYFTDGSFARLLPFLKGTFLAETRITPELSYDFGRSMALMVSELSSCKSLHFASKRSEWDLLFALKSKPLLKYIEDPHQRKIAHYFLDQFEHFTLPILRSFPRQLIHNDFNEWNVLCEEDKVCGVIDFGDATVTPSICELAIGLAYIMQKQELPLAIASEVIRGYVSISKLTKQEIEILPSLITTRICTSVCGSAKAKKESFDSDYILISEKGGWDLLNKWIVWSPILLNDLFKEAAGDQESNKKYSHLASEKTRKDHFSPALGLSYDIPIHMSSAAFQYMYDREGNAYLDAYNNIPLVGHSHPKVSEAASKQIRILNTNTRYHNQSIYVYAERLLEYFPAQLDRVFFVNSGTEANDLAQRLSKTFTNRNGKIVMEMGYHGHTTELVNLSAYKYNGEGGGGRNELVCELPLPKEYRGKYQRVEEYFNEAKGIIESCIDKGHEFSSLLVEPISGCGGQVPLIDGYLEQLVPWLKEKGVITISDEVQIGFGRLGRWFWGFEMQRFTPDIVVLGKPIGNGFPLAAVVTTQAIADAFDNGMEFFSSFGGNPIATEVGLAVLNIIEEEGLQKHSFETGEYFKENLRMLQNIHPKIGDVRGEGLFLGVEFINGDGSPGGSICKKVKNQLKEMFILTGSDGKRDEVLKMKPPLCFNRGNVDRVVMAMDKVLRTIR